MSVDIWIVNADEHSWLDTLNVCTLKIEDHRNQLN